MYKTLAVTLYGGCNFVKLTQNQYRAITSLQQ